MSLARPPRLAAALAAGLALSPMLVSSAAAEAAPPQATASLTLDEFYAPPASAVPGPAGSVVWWSDIAAGDPAELTKASSSRRVIYRSTSIAGNANVNSATVFVPAGSAPAGGWKVVAWNHVTTGGADHCAPSRASKTLPGSTKANPEFERLTRSGKLLSHLLERGYVVVRPDYEGIGTPGPHPYLIGRSLARATVDAVRAARELVPSTSNQYAVAGHSEGAIGALYTSQYTSAMAPELSLKATLAATPPIDNKTLLFEAAAATGLGGFTPLAALMVNGARLADPGLADAYDGNLLSGEGKRRFAHIETRCLGEFDTTSLGGISIPRMFGTGYPAVKPLLRAELDRNEAGNAKLGPEPVRFYSGGLDGLAWWSMIRATANRQRAKGADVTYKHYPFGTHPNITDDNMGGRDMARWLAAQLG